jgi:hypothetical protein
MARVPCVCLRRGGAHGARFGRDAAMQRGKPVLFPKWNSLYCTVPLTVPENDRRPEAVASPTDQRPLATLYR